MVAAVAVPVLAAAAVVLAVRGLVAVTVHGVSMEPTYSDGDRVLVWRRRRVRVGQVVVLRFPSNRGRHLADPPTPPDWLIKRVVAVAGQPALRGQVAGPAGPVPAGHLVVHGDNAADSVDSRQLGFIPVERILGTVVRVLPRRPAG